MERMTMTRLLSLGRRSIARPAGGGGVTGPAARTAGALLAGAALLLGAPGSAAAEEVRAGDLELDVLYLIAALEEAEDEPDRAEVESALAALAERLEAAPPRAAGRAWAGLDWIYRRLGRQDEANAAWRRARAGGFAGDRPDDPTDVFRPAGAEAPGLVGLVSVAAGSDSNPARLGPSVRLFAGTGFEETFPVLADGRPVPGDESDSVTLGALRLAWQPVFGAWTAGLAAEGRGVLHGDLDPLDRTELRGSLQLARGGDPAGFVTGPLGSVRVPRRNHRVGVLLQVGAGQSQLDGDRHVRATQAAGALLFRGGQRWATRLDLLRSDLDLTRRELPGDLSWSETTVGVVQGFFLGRQDRVLRLGASAGERSGERALEGSVVTGRLDLDLRLSRRWSTFLGAEIRRDELDHAESNPFWFPGLDPDELGPPRDETTWRLSALLVRELPGGLRLTVQASHEDRDAEDPLPPSPFDEDLDLLSYDRTTAAVGLAWRFGREGRP